MPTMRVLFVCSANVCRSRTAEQIFYRLVLADGTTHEARSAGTTADTSGRQLAGADLDWADVVCVMEPAHRAYIADRWNEAALKVRVLGIPDVYFPGDPVLEDVLTTHILLLLAEQGGDAGHPGHLP